MNRELPDIPGYDMEAELGRGGMGIVYKARQRTTGTTLALKMILCGRDALFQELARFRIEAEAMACLDHPNIIKIHDIGVFAGYPFIALDFAERGSLKQFLAGRRPAARWSAELVKTLALAMHHAHGRGMFHRDLKPANVLLMSNGVPKISDFGLVKFATRFAKMRNACLASHLPTSALDEELNRFACELGAQYSRFMDGEYTPEGEILRMTWQQCAKRTGLLGDSTRTATVCDFVTAAKQPVPSTGGRLPSLEDLTRSGSVMGSPQYMSPEQARGDLPRIGRHTDTYGLGAILYELLTGRPPFQAESLTDLLDQVRNVPPTPPRRVEPTIPPELEGVCLRCLEKDVGRRFPTAAALAEELQQFLDRREPVAQEQPPVSGGANPLEAPSTRSWWPFRRKSK
jgi:serine/threonine protein kinase